jgi:hypothetical protein
MNLPSFTAEASLSPARPSYRAAVVHGRSPAAGEVLPMLPRRPTIDTAARCINGAGEKGCGGLLCWCCYSDGCWICNSDYDDCVWDDAYRVQPVWRPGPWGGMITGLGLYNGPA